MFFRQIDSGSVVISKVAAGRGQLLPVWQILELPEFKLLFPTPSAAPRGRFKEAGKSGHHHNLCGEASAILY